jgi:hypothetical protein
MPNQVPMTLAKLQVIIEEIETGLYPITQLEQANLVLHELRELKSQLQASIIRSGK